MQRGIVRGLLWMASLVSMVALLATMVGCVHGQRNPWEAEKPCDSFVPHERAPEYCAKCGHLYVDHKVHRVQCHTHAHVEHGDVCVCNDGYKGDGVEVCEEDVDECATGTHRCHAYATCAKVPASYRCTCLPGYHGDGRKCTPTKEVLVEHLWDMHTRRREARAGGGVAGTAAGTSVLAKLQRGFVGQQHALKLIARSVKQRERGLHDSTRPQVFLFVGPSGTGKTEVAKRLRALLEEQQQKEQQTKKEREKPWALLRFDMANFQQREDIANLIGAPMGFGEAGKDGQLTMPLRDNPHTVVLLDEMEKGHPEAVPELLLPVFDEGRIVDQKRGAVDCSPAVFIMTTNAGEEELRALDMDSVKAGTVAWFHAVQARVRRLIKRVPAFHRTEFVGRIQHIVPFLPFTRAQQAQLVQIELDSVARRLYDRWHIKLVWQDEVLDTIVRRYYRPEQGVRSLRHGLLRFLEDELVDRKVAGTLTPFGRLMLVSGTSGTHEGGDVHNGDRLPTLVIQDHGISASPGTHFPGWNVDEDDDDNNNNNDRNNGDADRLDGDDEENERGDDDDEDKTPSRHADADAQTRGWDDSNSRFNLLLVEWMAAVMQRAMDKVVEATQQADWVLEVAMSPWAIAAVVLSRKILPSFLWSLLVIVPLNILALALFMRMGMILGAIGHILAEQPDATMLQSQGLGMLSTFFLTFVALGVSHAHTTVPDEAAHVSDTDAEDEEQTQEQEQQEEQEQEQKESTQEEQHHAAAKIQAVYRGNTVRRRMAKVRRGMARRPSEDQTAGPSAGGERHPYPRQSQEHPHKSAPHKTV